MPSEQVVGMVPVSDTCRIFRNDVTKVQHRWLGVVRFWHVLSVSDRIKFSIKDDAVFLADELNCMRRQQPGVRRHTHLLQFGTVQLQPTTECAGKNFSLFG